MGSPWARFGSMVDVGSLVSALAAEAEEKPQGSPHIQTALTFLTAWGNQRWDELKTVAAVQVTVKVADKAFTLEPAAQKAEVALVFPFRGLSTDRKSTRLNSSHDQISYAVFCLKKKKSVKYENLILR